MTFETLDALLKFFHGKGCTQILFKQLAENDNSKQQVYLGGSFEVLRFIPFQSITADSERDRPNFKAKTRFFWVSGTGELEGADGAQLILYPDYPEVRLSGFLRGCSSAPSELMRPIPADRRRFNNGPDGRLLFFGIVSDTIIAYLAPAGSAVSIEINERINRGEISRKGVFFDLAPVSQPDFREILLDLLRAIHRRHWHRGQRLDDSGRSIPYAARNAGGYTLEALLGIRPNGRALPDLMGWEIKAYSGNRITLMTPEPDGGFYGSNGVQAFVRRFGRTLPGNVIYFTGSHKANVKCVTSGLKLQLSGFDPRAKKIVDVTGGIQLVDGQGFLTAEWSFRSLIDHWGRKHAAAAYVRYKKSPDLPVRYAYGSPALLGQETDFSFFLSACEGGDIVYDPASKIVNASQPNPRTKARSQFRVSVRNLPQLYRKFETVDIS